MGGRRGTCEVAVSPSKILVGQCACVLGLITGSTWGATQWAAAQLGFQSRLGTPWFELDGWPFHQSIPVYYPWRLFQWWYAYEAYAPKIFQTAGLIAAAGGLLGAAAAIIG